MNLPIARQIIVTDATGTYAVPCSANSAQHPRAGALARFHALRCQSETFPCDAFTNLCLIPRRRATLISCRAQDSNSEQSPDVGPSTRGQGPDRAATLRGEAEQSNAVVYDRLIEVFLSRPPEDWRKLIANSSKWNMLSEGVIARMEARAAALDENGQGSKEFKTEEEREEAARRLRKTARRLKTVSDEMREYYDLVALFRDSPSREWESLVARHRASLSSDFFDYMELRIRAAAAAAADSGSSTSREAESLAALGTQIAALVEAHDRVLADESALDAAASRFSDLLLSESMEAAEAKIDEFASSGQLDPALLLTMARAYAGVKETDATKEEVKDIMAHLYFKAKESFAQQAPPEARILKFLLAVESANDRTSLLEQALQPGAPISTAAEDFLYTTPEALLNTIENVLAMYDNAQGGAPASSTGSMGMAAQAATLMNPEVILRLRELQALIRKNYL